MRLFALFDAQNGCCENLSFLRLAYLPNNEITVEYLIKHARENHKIGLEGQTLLVIDEAGIILNARDTRQFDRKSWVDFFMTHRHYGYNVILVAQFDRMIDRQIRSFIEYEIKHRKANNFRALGLILTILHIPVFVAITYWYGMRERCSSEFFRYRKRDSKLYDTMMLFGGEQHGEKIGIKQEAATDKDGDTEACEGGDPSLSVPQISIDADLLKPPDALTWANDVLQTPR